MPKYMDKNSLLELIPECVRAIEQAKVDYAFAEEELTRCEQLTQDYLHKLELEDPGYHECARIARDISQCRLDRRNAKDTITRYQSVVEFLETEKGRSALNQLQQLLGSLRKAENQLAGRVYTPRVLSEQEYRGERK